MCPYILITNSYQDVEQLLKSGSQNDLFFYQAHDLSCLRMLEEGGCIYKDTIRNNETRPAEAILGDEDMNAVRLRIWVNFVGGTYGLQYNLDLAKRFQNKGYKMYLAFHFA
jgi:arabinogalactan endo-1,4-beta-galactosidase